MHAMCCSLKLHLFDNNNNINDVNTHAHNNKQVLGDAAGSVNLLKGIKGA